jgi:hypothetical protein
LRERLRLQKESEALAAEASDRVQRIAEELRLLKGKVSWKREGRFEET